MLPGPRHLLFLRLLFLRLLFLRLLFLCLLCLLPCTASAAEWVYLDNGQIRLGVDKAAGACIGHFSASGTNDNLLDHYDTGRFLQQSYYGDPDGSQWVEKPWVYNPVQGGEYRGKPSELLEFESTETTLVSRTRPRNWAGGELLPEVIMHQSLRLEGLVAELRFRLDYDGKKTHQPRHQEIPAMFIGPRYATLVTYAGKRPWTGDELIRRTPSFPNEPLRMTENWAAYVNADDFGIGIYVPMTQEGTCYRFEAKGAECSYLAPLTTFALEPGKRFTYTAYLTVGSVDEIRARFQKLHEAAAKSP